MRLRAWPVTKIIYKVADSLCIGGFERQCVRRAGSGECAVERGRCEISSGLNKDAEHVAEGQPLASPISTAIPKVDHVDVASKRASWLFPLLPLQAQKHFGESERLNPPVSGVPGDICGLL